MSGECAGGCGGIAVKKSMYCADCRLRACPYDDGPTDMETVLLKERLAEKGPWTRRIDKYGTRVCKLCGREALPGRLYCSNMCRHSARKERPAEIVVDGISASISKHAERLGIWPSTVYRRLQLGWSVEDALTKPVDANMRRRGTDERRRDAVHQPGSRGVD